MRCSKLVWVRARSSFNRVVWSGRRPSRAGAEPGGEAAFLGDGGEGIIGFTGAERELLAARLPAEFLDKQLGEIPVLQERAGALEVEGHRSIFADAERADDFGLAGFDVILRDAEAVFPGSRSPPLAGCAIPPGAARSSTPVCRAAHVPAGPLWRGCSSSPGQTARGGPGTEGRS